MEIIQQNAKVWEHPFTCSGCGSELKAEAKDVRMATFGLDDGPSPYVTCPICKQDHELRCALPPAVWDMAERRSRRR